MKMLLDCNMICHMAKHTTGDLTYSELKTGVIFGFLWQLLSLAKVLQSREFCFIWDSPESLRTNLFPDYKKNRIQKEKTDEERERDAIAFSQFSTIRKDILPAIGFKNIYSQRGYEGDDIIASIVQHDLGPFIIVSSDNDLYQLLREEVSMYSLKTKSFFGVVDFRKEYSIKPHRWARVKAIMGCKTDGVPGVPGIGVSNAVKFVDGVLPPASKAYHSIKSNKEIIERNQVLVTLPFPGVDTFFIQEDDNLSLEGFMYVCQKYGFHSFLKSEGLDQWIRIFGLK
jgi:5'-3' exonuclease